MDFEFTDEQRLLQRTVREFLGSAAPIDRVRAQWDTDTGHSPDLWRQLAEIGVCGLLVREELGGLGLDEIDLVLVGEELGRAAVAEPSVPLAAAVPLLGELPNFPGRDGWLSEIATGERVVVVDHVVDTYCDHAHVADPLLVVRAEAITAFAPDELVLTPRPSNDPARRLFSVEPAPGAGRRLAEGPLARVLCEATVDRAALACAAQALGVTDRLIEMAVRHAGERRQFGVAIGTFQAVKHLLADVRVRLEYARSLVYRAAHSVARSSDERSVDVSMAKSYACETATETAKVALQVHGAIGYTQEHDLHVWMRRAWSLEASWGSAAWHRARVAAGVIDRLTPARPFGFAPAEGEG